LLLLDIHDAAGGLLGDELLEFFEFHGETESMTLVDGLDEGDLVVFLVLASAVYFYFRIPSFRETHVGVVGFIERRERVGELRIGINDRGNTQVLARFFAADIVLV